MAKQIDYPRASLKNSLELAQAVDELGGNSSIEMTADKMNKKVSGAFQALIGSASKFGLVTSKKGQLGITTLYRDYKLAYSKTEADLALTRALLSPPLFWSIFERFKGRELPVDHFEKLLIREFGVPDQISSRVSKYFLEGARQCEILNAENILQPEVIEEANEAEQDAPKTSQEEGQRSTNPVYSDSMEGNDGIQEDIAEDGRFSVRIKGPGMDSVIIVNEEEDLLIIRAMLKKVEKKLSSPVEKSEWSNDDQT